LIRVF